MTEWIEDPHPPRDYADDDTTDATAPGVGLLIQIAIFNTLLGLGAGWLLWG